MIRVVDAVGAAVSLASPARRVVSLVPSVTETVFALGAGRSLVGCTTFCIHPAEGVAKLAKVGGTKDPDLGGIRSLAPDLVLANREENRESDVLELREGLNVHVSYPRDLASLLSYLGDLGLLLGCEDRARSMARGIARAKEAHARPPRSLRALYLIWRRPWMAAGGDTFIDAMLRECGFENALAGAADRYPEVRLESFRGLLDAVLLSSEPFPFGERHRAEVARACGLPLERVQLVSGEAFSWFGCRTQGVFAEAARVSSALASAR